MREFKTEHDGSYIHQVEKTPETQADPLRPEAPTDQHYFGSLFFRCLALFNGSGHDSPGEDLLIWLISLEVWKAPALYTRACSGLHLQRFDSHTDEEDAYQTSAVIIWICMSAVRSMFRRPVENKHAEWKMCTSAGLQEREYTEDRILVWWGGRRPPIPVPRSIGKNYILTSVWKEWTMAVLSEASSESQPISIVVIPVFPVSPQTWRWPRHSLNPIKPSEVYKRIWRIKYAVTYKKSCSVCLYSLSDSLMKRILVGSRLLFYST